MNTWEFITAWHGVMAGKENNEKQGKRNYSEYKWERRKEKEDRDYSGSTGDKRKSLGRCCCCWFFFFFFLSERKGGKGKKRRRQAVWTGFSRVALVECFAQVWRVGQVTS